MKNRVKRLLLTVIILVTNLSLYAQDDPDDPLSQDPGLPIDDYIIVVLVAALFFGFILIYKRKSQLCNQP